MNLKQQPERMEERLWTNLSLSPKEIKETMDRIKELLNRDIGQIHPRKIGNTQYY